MHRDISAGNLLKLSVPVEREKLDFDALWKIAEEFDIGTGDVAGVSEEGTTDIAENLEKMSLAKSANMAEELKKAVKELQDLLTAVDTDTTTRAVVIDGDLAAFLDEYFKDNANRKRGALSVSTVLLFVVLWPNDAQRGTTEFQSTKVHEAKAASEPYLQSPIDDAFSFFYVFIWHVLFNDKDQGVTKKEDLWRCQVRGTFEEREFVANQKIPRASEDKALAIIVQRVSLGTGEWYNGLNHLDESWSKLEAAPSFSSLHHKSKKSLFYYFGIMSVALYVNLLNKNMRGLKGM